jgi:PAS domain S-box-containing protein
MGEPHGAHTGKEKRICMKIMPKRMQLHSGPDKAGQNHTHVTQGFASSVNWSDLSQSDHFVQFYETDDSLLDSVSEFIKAGLDNGTACIVIATPEHREALAHRLQTNNLDPSDFHAQGKYFALDAAETLSQFLLDGSLDPEQFARITGGIIGHAVKGQKRVRIFGEMVTLLWQQGDQEAALYLEALWNELRSTTHPFSLFCAYPMALFTGQEHDKPFSKVCDLHSQVIPSEICSRLTCSDERLRAVSPLQQKALSLTAEIVVQGLEERLRTSENRYRRLFESSTDGILIVDPRSGIITDTNPFMMHLLGSTREQVMDRELWQVGLMPDQPTQQAFLRRLQQDRLLRFEMMLSVRQDGHPCYVEWVSTLFQANGCQMIQCNVRDITDRKQAEIALLHMAAIVSSSDDAIIGKDLDGVIISWNAAAERMYGYSAQEILGQSITLLFPSDHREEFAQIMERIRQGEPVDHYETIRVCKDGRHLHVSVTVSPIRDSDGIIIGASAIARDISERKELEQQREAFVSLVTHELKTPLTILQGNVQLAQRRLTRLLSQGESLTEEQQRWLEDVLVMLVRTQQPLRVQQRLINDLLDITRIREDKVELYLAVFDLVRLVCETVQDHQTVHADRLITLDLPEQDPITVCADRDRIQQVLSNYLSNALKFAPATEPIQVGMTLEAGTVRVWVQDRGPGLTPRQQAHIWERCYQVSQTPTQNGWKVGLGLGLYICQQLIHRQQGKVGVESIPGQGATFWFTLPVHSS